VIDILIL